MDKSKGYDLAFRSVGLMRNEWVDAKTSPNLSGLSQMQVATRADDLEMLLIWALRNGVSYDEAFPTKFHAYGGCDELPPEGLKDLAYSIGKKINGTKQ